jgi:hypothetical protein
LGFDGELTPLSKLPAVVRQAAEDAAPEVKWVIAFKFQGTKPWFRLGGNDARKRFIMVKVDSDGKLGWFFTELQPEEVPEVVRKALKAKMPTFTPKRHEGASKDAKTFEVYRFEGEMPKGKKEVVLVTPNGMRVMTEAEALRAGK